MPVPMDITNLFNKVPVASTRPLNVTQRTFEEKQADISGIAYAGSIEGRGHLFLVCHDNKDDPHVRFGLITLDDSGAVVAADPYQSIDWPDPATRPNDLEGLCGVPGMEKEFIAIASGYNKDTPIAAPAFWVTLAYDANGRNPSVVTSLIERDLMAKSRIANPSSNGAQFLLDLESVAMQRIEDKILVAWAHKGDFQTNQGVLLWGEFDISKKEFPSCPDWHEQIVRYPTTKVGVEHPDRVSDTRTFSDMYIRANGDLIIASAIDRGDNGPFASSVYKAGRFSYDRSVPGFVFFANRSLEMPELMRSEDGFRTLSGKKESGHKIEGIEFLPEGMTAELDFNVVFGTDDENHGPYIYAGTI